MADRDDGAASRKFPFGKAHSSDKVLFVVPLAVCFADGQVLERLKGFAVVKNHALNKLLKFLITTFLLICMFLLYDSSWGIQRFEFALNGLIPVTLIYWAYEFL